MRIRRRIGWLAGLGALGVLACLFAGSGVTRAHALLVQSQPLAGAELAAAPPAIELWFSEPLEPQFSDAYLVDAAGTEIARGAATVDAADPTHLILAVTDLSPGIYTVVWRTLSRTDGHEWVGSFPLTLLNPDGTRPQSSGSAAAVDDGPHGELPTPLETVSRWLSLLGAVLLCGVLFLRMPIGGDHSATATASDFQTSVSRSAIELVCIGGGAVMLGGWLQWMGQVFTLNAGGAPLDLLFRTRAGNLNLCRQLLVGAILIGVILAARRSVRSAMPWFRRSLALTIFYTVLMAGAVGWLSVQRPNPIILLGGGLGLIGSAVALVQIPRHGNAFVPPRLVNWLVWLLSVVLLLTFSVGSHAAAVSGSGWAILGDFVHFVAVALWLGGLTMVALLLWRLRMLPTATEAPLLRPVVIRFSALATLAVFVLVVTGIFSSLVQLRTLSLLWSSTYGRLLLIKIVLVGVVLGGALRNHRLVWDAPTAPWSVAQYRALQRQVWSEALLSLVLMVVVAILVQTPVPQPSVAAAEETGAFAEILRADDLSIHLQISPNRVGDNRYETHLYHDDGSPIGDVQLVRLFFVHEEAELGQASLDLSTQGGGLFAGEGAYQNRAGPWDVSVYVRRRGLDDALAETTVEIPAPAGGTTAERTPWQNPIDSLPAGIVVGGMLLALLLLPLIGWRTGLGRHSLQD